MPCEAYWQSNPTTSGAPPMARLSAMCGSTASTSRLRRDDFTATFDALRCIPALWSTGLQLGKIKAMLGLKCDQVSGVRGPRGSAEAWASIQYGIHACTRLIWTLSRKDSTILSAPHPSLGCGVSVRVGIDRPRTGLCLHIFGLTPAGLSAFEARATRLQTLRPFRKGAPENGERYIVHSELDLGEVVTE